MITLLKNNSLAFFLLISMLSLTLVSFKKSISHYAPLPATVEYSILDGSSISVLGSTNINEFACLSKDQYSQQKIDFYNDDMKQVIHFKEAKLKVTTASLNCGNAAMNSNLCKTLNADKFPYIIVELMQVQAKDGKPLNNQNLSSMTASVAITLAGERKINTISFTGKKTSSGTYHFSGQHNLSLNAYHLQPPEALFGLIKVNDMITVKFELNVSANEVIVQ